MKKYDVIIIGGGIVGLSTAWQLKKKYPSYAVCVLEKEDVLAMHQSGHNSGVIHAGVYYTPGSMKAKFCVEGNVLVREFCDANNIPYIKNGKLVVATNELELSRMQNLIERCTRNNVEFEVIDQKRIKALEPNINGIGAIYSPNTGIVDYALIARKYAELFVKLGGEIITGHEINQINEANSEVQITTIQGGKFASEYLISCAGLYADRIVKFSGLTPDFKILPFRGQYYDLSSHLASTVKHLIYPVPDPKLPFLGVHLTNTMSGKVIVGPSAMLAFAREGYSLSKVNLADALEILRFKGTWKIIYKNFKATIDELKSALSINHYAKLVQKYMPLVTAQDLKLYPAGVRAQAVDLNGNFIEDFMFQKTKRMLHVANAPSPAATSSMPIGAHILSQLEEMF